MESNALISFDRTLEVLNAYAQEAVEAYRQEMADRGKNASGKLSRSVKQEVRAVGGGLFGPEGAAFEVTLTLPAYWWNVEFGRPPCPPSKGWIPVDALLKWIKVKPIIPRPDKNGRVPTPKQLAFLINRAINDPDRRGDEPKRPGIAPTPVLQSALEKVDAKFDGLLKAAMYADIDVFLNKLSFGDFSSRAAAKAAIKRGPHK